MKHISTVFVGTFIALAGLLPHLVVRAKWAIGGSDHEFSLFGDVGLREAGTTTLDEVAHLDGSADLYRLYSASVHAHLCFYAWLVGANVKSPRRFFRYLVCASILSGVVTAASMIFLSDSFSTEGVAHYDGFFQRRGSDLRHAYKVLGYRGYGAMSFLIVPFFLSVHLYLSL